MRHVKRMHETTAVKEFVDKMLVEISDKFIGQNTDYETIIKIKYIQYISFIGEFLDSFYKEKASFNDERKRLDEMIDSGSTDFYIFHSRSFVNIELAQVEERIFGSKLIMGLAWNKVSKVFQEYQEIKDMLVSDFKEGKNSNAYWRQLYDEQFYEYNAVI